jgi:hypothetical protein
MIKVKKIKKGIVGYLGDIPIIINDNSTGDNATVFWMYKLKKNRLGPFKY